MGKTSDGAGDQAHRLAYDDPIPDRSRKPRVPRDTNQRAFQVVALLTGTAPPEPPHPKKDPAAVSLGRRRGLEGREGAGAKAHS